MVSYRSRKAAKRKGAGGSHGDATDERATLPRRSGIGPFEPADSECIQWIEVDDLTTDPSNPRRSTDDEELLRLARSMVRYGTVVPLEVDEARRVVLGERRLQAARRAGIERVPCLVRKVPKGQQRIERQLVVAQQTAALPALEKAKAWSTLKSTYGLQAAADLVGVTPEHFGRTVQMVELPAETRRLVDEGLVSGRSARVLASVEEPDLQRALTRKVTAEALTTRQVERLVPSARRASEPVRSELVKVHSVLTPEMADVLASVEDQDLQKELVDVVRLEKLGVDELQARVTMALQTGVVPRKDGTITPDATWAPRYIEGVATTLRMLDSYLDPDKALQLSDAHRRTLAALVDQWIEARLDPYLEALHPPKQRR